MDEAEPAAHPQGMPPVAPGLLSAILTMRALTHIFLVVGVLGVLVSLGAPDEGGPIAAAVFAGLFLACYFAWVGLVLFGCMSFSLAAMLWFVLGLGACIGLLMSLEGPLMLLGGLGLLIMVFATVIPVSRHDPTTTQEKREKGTSTVLLLLSLPFVCILLIMSGSVLAVVGGAGLALLTIGIVIPHGPHGAPEWREYERNG